LPVQRADNSQANFRIAEARPCQLLAWPSHEFILRDRAREASWTGWRDVQVNPRRSLTPAHTGKIVEDFQQLC